MADILDEPKPFAEALKHFGDKIIMPTNLDTAGLRQLDAGMRRGALYSAKTEMTRHLENIKGVVQGVLNPQVIERADRITADNPTGKVEVGLDPASAKLKLLQGLREQGYIPNPDEAGTLKDLSSDARLGLVVKTNVELAQGFGHFIRANDPDVLDAFPAQELIRFTPHAKQRDWPGRWRTAAAASGDTDAIRILNETGRMIARTDSPIWDSLGSSDLFPDGLDNPYPPFAFNSGMGVAAVDFDTAEKLGLVTPTNIPKPRILDFLSFFDFTGGSDT